MMGRERVGASTGGSKTASGRTLAMEVSVLCKASEDPLTSAGGGAT